MAKSIESLAGVTRVGLDLAKNVFHFSRASTHGGEVVIVRKLRRGAVLPFFGRLGKRSCDQDLPRRNYGTLPFPDGAIIAALHWNDVSSDADNEFTLSCRS